jgi:hypothetical protein
MRESRSRDENTVTSVRRIIVVRHVVAFLCDGTRAVRGLFEALGVTYCADLARSIRVICVISDEKPFCPYDLPADIAEHFVHIR